MKKITSIITFAALLAFGNTAFAKDVHSCNKDALDKAAKLLSLHTEADERASVEETVKEATPLKNPHNKKQEFDVLEVWGHVYKANYRMRFIYAQLEGSCALMGQEIIEFADL